MINPFRRRSKSLRFPNGIPRVPVSLLEQREEQPTMLDKLRVKISSFLPQSRRETMHRYIVALVGSLLAAGLVTDNQAELWTRLALSSVSLLFAWLYATDTVRAALYGIAATVGGVLFAWGVAHHVDLALVVGTFLQGLGVATAAANANPSSSTRAPAPIGE